MSKYKILIVDENEDQISDFETFFDNISKLGLFENIEFETFSIKGLDDEEDLFSFVRDNEIDCVTFDYKLMENNSSFSQQGDIYQYHLLEHFEDFPTIILTNNADESKLMKADPFKIVSKSVINFDSEDKDQTEEARKLVDKIVQSIDKYKENISSAEEQLLSLIEKQQAGTELTEEDIQNMIDCDSKLENSISKKSKIPKEWKKPEAIQTIADLVAKSDDILTELKKLTNG